MSAPSIPGFSVRIAGKLEGKEGVECIPQKFSQDSTEAKQRFDGAHRECRVGAMRTPRGSDVGGDTQKLFQPIGALGRRQTEQDKSPRRGIPSRSLPEKERQAPLALVNHFLLMFCEPNQMRRRRQQALRRRGTRRSPTRAVRSVSSGVAMFLGTQR